MSQKLCPEDQTSDGSNLEKFEPVVVPTRALAMQALVLDSLL